MNKKVIFTIYLCTNVLDRACISQISHGITNMNVDRDLGLGLVGGFART